MKKVPILILSGFLGSGKTTLLTKMLTTCVAKGMRPAIIMNEVGDVNLDGQLLEESVPMREMLSGCICCTIRGDLGMEIKQLVDDLSPDLIIIEATGVANPMEIFDGVTEAALLVHVEIKAMITVIDAAHFMQWHRKGSGRTYHLMRDQIRCASMLLVNKSDLISTTELDEMKQIIHLVNPVAAIYSTVYCEFDQSWIEGVLQAHEFVPVQEGQHHNEENVQHTCEHHHHDHEHDHHHDYDHDGNHSHSYDHVMVYTHYFNQPIDSERFEQFVSQLPDKVYRAKGIFTSAETGERMLFQFAYRQLELFRIQPQGKVHDVAVFMGEQFSQNELKLELDTTI
ncbi:cobalamin biosynthesis protein CobW [Paenibacillus rhizosphaerae]|uniref:Cobalamin biosynthesis protein CobW n=1 Tax=Paenibacillus rhizosphaerae TaxID=297318 RepID=A0A1R1ECH5_9BACL|nr:GTP-binding protein [Paenibacillus rhizosphaerae]OMF49482.1 cobalamin biosynthesis protein CobW [Paenibacillus rhizosphaerae]